LVRGSPCERFDGISWVSLATSKFEHFDEMHSLRIGDREDVEMRRRMIRELHRNPGSAETPNRRHGLS
jgi:hypothetical protein